MTEITDGEWHTHGTRVKDGVVEIYMDRKLVSKVPVPKQFETSYYALVSLVVLPKEADIAEDPFSINADYIRAYAKR